MSSSSSSKKSSSGSNAGPLHQVRDNVTCAFCTREVVNCFYIKCAVCTNVHLCADCFTAGVNLAPHVNTHAYTIPDCLEHPLFDNAWTVREELQLLDAIEKYGVGNWKVISDALPSGKTVKQVEDHYWQTLLGTHGYCLPSKYTMNNEVLEMAALFPTEPTVDAEGSEVIPADDLFRIPVNAGYQRGEEVKRDEGKESGKPKDRNEINNKIMLLPGSEIPGYMPLRQDFEVEYENDAELMLADMEFLPDDHPSERELKLQVIRIYNQKLEERRRRRHFVIDRNLVDVKAQQAKEKKLSKEERDLVGKLRVFARFHSHEDHEALVDGILKAQRLKQQIELYKIYRQMGLRTLEQVRQFEADRKTRERENRMRKQREAAPHLYSSYSSTYEDKKFSSNASVNSADQDAGDVRSKKRGRQSRGGEEEAPSASGRSRLKSTRSTGSTDADQLQSPEAFTEAVELIRKAPGGELLSEVELELCAKLPIFPYHYLAIKDALVREAYRNGSLTPEGVQRIIKVEADKSETIYDFFVKELKVNDAPKRG